MTKLGLLLQQSVHGCLPPARYTSPHAPVHCREPADGETVAAFDLLAPPAPVQKSVGQCTSGMCVEILPEVGLLVNGKLNAASSVMCQSKLQNGMCKYQNF